MAKKLTTQQQIIRLLKTTCREGMGDLIDWLVDRGYFTSPASRSNHNAYAGGLADHHYGVYLRLSGLNIELNLQCPQGSVIIAALLHDVCKVGYYVKKGKKYGLDPDRDRSGHASLSIERIEGFIKLTDIEMLMIKFHMGVYALTEFEETRAEYSLGDEECLSEYTLRDRGMAYAWYHHPIVKVMYFCDELATLSEKLK